jgi:hypothetical protein
MTSLRNLIAVLRHILFIIIVPNAFLRDVDLLNVVAPQNVDFGKVEMKGERLCQKSVGFSTNNF